MTATNLSGLQITTTYYFKVNTVEYSILTGDPAPTFQEVANLMDTALSSAGFSTVISGDVPNQDIRVINEGDRGWGSEIDLSYGTSGPNLWINLTDFVEFDEAVPGRGDFSVNLKALIGVDGKVQTGGTATYFHIDEPPVGSIIISGTSLPTIVDIVGTQAFGSLLTGGTAYYKIGYVWLPGGIQDDVEVGTFGDIVYRDNVYMSANPESGIKIEIGGAAEYEMGIIATVEGGKTVLDGTATTGVDIVATSDGGITIEGSVAVDEFTLSFESSGATTFAGAGDTEHSNEFKYETSGEVSFNGSGIVAIKYTYNGLYFGDNYYPFNEKTGTTVNDMFAGNNDITLSASDLWTDDAVFISAVQFDKDDWSTLGTDIEPQAVSFWHKRKTVDQDSYRVFGASADDQHWYFAYEPLYFRTMIRNGASYYYFFNGTDYILIPDDGQYHWYYIEFYSGSNAAIYIDNAYRGTTSVFFGTGTYKLHTIGNGGDAAGPGVYGFGLIDDLRIYSSYRLDTIQRNSIYTQSPDPGSFVLGGAAHIQPVILAGDEYVYVPTGSIVVTGGRYIYLVKSTIITISGIAPTDIEFTYIGSGGMILQSSSTYHDFGLGYVYEPSGGIKLTSKNLMVIIIETSYYILIQEIGIVLINGSAANTGYYPQYEYIGSSTSVLSGTADTEYYPQYEYVASGEALHLGSGEYSITYEYVASGTSVLSGIADTEYYPQYEYVASGEAFTLGISTYQKFGLGYEYEGSNGTTFDGESDTSGPPYGFYGGGGDSGGDSNVIDYIDMTLTSGNAIDRGDLTLMRNSLAGVSGSQYGFYGGGFSGGNSNVIDYINMNLITGNAIDRGDLTIARYGLAGVSGSQYGFYGGGFSGGDGNIIDYIDMSLTTGNATDRGNLTIARDYLAGVSGSQYGFYGGGNASGASDVIDYIDMSLTTGNAVDRGNLTLVRYYLAGVSGSQYGFYGGGSFPISNIVDYIDMSLTTGNAIDKGDLTVARDHLAGVSGSQYGFYCGGTDIVNFSNVVDYIDITTTTGNATDRGDLTIVRGSLAGVS